MVKMTDTHHNIQDEQTADHDTPCDYTKNTRWFVITLMAVFFVFASLVIGLSLNTRVYAESEIVKMKAVEEFIRERQNAVITNVAVLNNELGNINKKLDELIAYKKAEEARIWRP